MPAKHATKDMDAQLAYLTRALKAPTLREALPRLLERAHADGVVPRRVPRRVFGA